MRGKISFHVGKKLSQKHNLRDYDKDKWNTDKHIDDSRSHLNVVVKNENLEEFFDKVFGEALLDFNEKNYSKHPDRVIGYGKEKVDELVKKYGLEKTMELVRKKSCARVLFTAEEERSRSYYSDVRQRKFQCSC